MLSVRTTKASISDDFNFAFLKEFRYLLNE